MHGITVEGSSHRFSCDSGDTMLGGGLRAGLGMPYECAVGGCGTCKFELLEGEVEEVWSAAPGLSDRDRAKGRKLACQCRPTSDCRIKIRLDDACRPIIVPRRFVAVLASSEDVTHDIREFRFRAASPATFLPGQFALLRIPGVPGVRAYSMANLPNDEGDWHFQVRRVEGGAASSALFDRLDRGAQVQIDGPYGTAHLRTTVARDVVCVAGGSGLAPMLSIARGMSQSGMLETQRLHFFYGAREVRDVCGEAQLSALQGFGDRIRFYPVVSSPDLGNGTTWRGQTGFVHQHVEQVIGAQMPECEFYMAGPPRMIQAMQDMLHARHAVPTAQVHYDRFF